MTYDTLTNLWSTTSQKPFLAVSNDGRYVYIQTMLYNNWFFAKPMSELITGYQTDGTGVLLRGDESIWSIL